MPSNRGTLFWLAYPGNLAPNAELYILASRETPFEVAIPGQGFSVTGNAGPDAPGIVFLPENFAAVQSSEMIEQKGIRVTSERPVTVILRGGTVGVLGSTEAYLGLPVDMLGSDYYTVLGYQESVSARGFPGNDEPSQLTIVAVEDNTQVTVTPSCESLAGSQPGVPINLVLNQGEVWQYRCGFLRDVTGTRVRSSRPIAVFGGSRCSDVPPGVAFCDYLVEQLIPVDMWRREYFVPPLLNGAANLVRVLASEDETRVQISDGTNANTITVYLDAGEFYEDFFDEAVRVMSSKPVMVGQYSVGAQAPPANNERDPLFLQILPARLFSRFHRFYNPPQYNINLVNIVAPVGGLCLWFFDRHRIRLSDGIVSTAIRTGGGLLCRTASNYFASDHSNAITELTRPGKHFESAFTRSWVCLTRDISPVVPI